jgi:hypothetical protein
LRGPAKSSDPSAPIALAGALGYLEAPDGLHSDDTGGVGKDNALLDGRLRVLRVVYCAQYPRSMERKVFLALRGRAQRASVGAAPASRGHRSGYSAQYTVRRTRCPP